MNKQIVQRISRLIGYPVWVGGTIVLVSLAVGGLLLYVVPESWYVWFDSSLGTFVLEALIYILATLVIILPLRLARRTGEGGIRKALGLAKPPRLVMVPWSLLSWGLYFGVSTAVMIGLSLMQLPGIDLNQTQQIGFVNLQYGYEYVAAFVALVILAPFFEELMFRGYLYGKLRHSNGFLLSALVTSATFGVVHFQFNVGVDVFILSLFLCFLREKFDSIWPGVFVHAFKNALAYILLFILPLYGVNLLQ